MTKTFPTDKEIETLLRERIDVCKRAFGGVIGVVDDAGSRTVSYGYLSADRRQCISPHTIFEIGCVTKVLTALVCADMIESAEVGLNEPVGKYLPPSVSAVDPNGVAITFRHLLTHTGGLTREADAFGSVEAFETFMSHLPVHDVGAHFRYSTTGYALLSYALERRCGTSIEQLIRERVCERVGMTDTTPEIQSSALDRFATGYDAGLVRVPRSLKPMVAGGFGFVSTTEDLLRLVGACAGLFKTECASAIRRAMSIRRSGAPGGEEVALGWFVSRNQGQDIFYHTGGSDGHRAFIGYAPGLRRGVVALINAVTPVGLSDVCRHLLNPAYPVMRNESVLLASMVDPPNEICIGGDRLEQYVGLYQLTPRAHIMVTRMADELYISAAGEQRQRLIPVNETDFWMPASNFRPPATVKFVCAGSHHATSATMWCRGLIREYQRVDEVIESIWYGKCQIAIDKEDLVRYEGRYQFSDHCVTIERFGTSLWLGRAGAKPRELMHTGQHQFVIKADVAEIALLFELDSNGTTVAVTSRIANSRCDPVLRRGTRVP